MPHPRGTHLPPFSHRPGARSPTRSIPWPAGIGGKLALLLLTQLAAGAAPAEVSSPWSFSAGRSRFRRTPPAANVALLYRHEAIAGPLRPAVGFVGTTRGDRFVFAGFGAD